MKRAMVLTGCLVLALALACGSSDDSDSGAGADSPGGGEGAASGSETNGSGASGQFTSGASCAPPPDDSGCVGEAYAGETIPLDIYIMFDQSCSMSCPVETTGQPGQCCPGGPDPRIDPVREAVDEFLRDPLSAGIGVGIGYFGFMEIGSTSCDADDYESAAVGIDRLPGHADALLDSLYSVEPTGETPTGAAIRGACSYASDWRLNHTGHAVVILLVTDGVPEAPNSNDCNPSVEDAAAAARECLDGDAQIPTYVLGIGRALSNLNEIAAAGGTDAAYLVDGDRNSVLEALNAIRGQAVIPCELQIPPPPEGEVLATNQVNLVICDAAGEVVVTYYVETAEGCQDEQGGWYYDDPANPSRILLCEPTCETVSMPGAQLYYSIGCQTQSIPE
jgi:hypothetical protein